MKFTATIELHVEWEVNEDERPFAPWPQLANGHIWSGRREGSLTEGATLVDVDFTSVELDGEPCDNAWLDGDADLYCGCNDSIECPLAKHNRRVDGED